MIKNIIFDLGNVIINYNQQAIMDKFASTSEEQEYIKEKFFKAPEWAKCDLGEITNEEAAKAIFERENKYPEMTKNFWKDWYKTQKINEDIVNIARKLKNEGYNIFVLSNMANPTYEFFKGHDFFKLCTGIIISAHEHMKKPDERIFLLLLNRYNLNAEECLFIDDDDTGRSYETANRIGIKGRRVEPNSKEDILKLLFEYDISI